MRTQKNKDLLISVQDELQLGSPQTHDGLRRVLHCSDRRRFSRKCIVLPLKCQSYWHKSDRHASHEPVDVDGFAQAKPVDLQVGQRPAVGSARYPKSGVVMYSSCSWSKVCCEAQTTPLVAMARITPTEILPETLIVYTTRRIVGAG